MTSRTPLLSVRNLTAGYNHNPVLHEINLDVHQGDVVALIGANGAGKTSLLRCVSGLLAPTAGQIFVQQADVTRAPSHVRVNAGLIHVPEGRQVFADLSVADNLRMGAYRASAFAERDARLAQILPRFPRLRERMSQLAGLLSGGEQQMLALARGLMADPLVLMLDEPSMGLAPLFVDEIFDLLATLKNEGRTILLVEQNASAALALADYAYVLEQGRITSRGPASALAHDPRIMSAYLGHAPAE